MGLVNVTSWIQTVSPTWVPCVLTAWFQNSNSTHWWFRVIWKIWWKTLVVHAGEIQILFKARVVYALGKAVKPVLRFSMLQAAHHTRASQYPDFKEILVRELCKNRQASPLRKVLLFSQSWICWIMPGIWNGKVQTRFIKPQQAQGKIIPVFLFFHSLSLMHTQSQSEMHYPGSGGQLCLGLEILNSEKQKLIMDSQTPLSSSDKIHISGKIYID